MHHADPATLAVAGAQARRQGGCFGETLPLLSSSTPDTPLPAVRCCLRAGAGRSLPCGVACQVRLLVGCELVQRMRSDASTCVCLRHAMSASRRAGFLLRQVRLVREHAPGAVVRMCMRQCGLCMHTMHGAGRVGVPCATSSLLPARRECNQTCTKSG